ncbi:MAG: HNH endonuclease, partial [Actinomycetia bacterium]|nr:HNH endonuclease [Actinomycetes bacterium]
RPPASLRRHVVNRHTRCAFPGCARRAIGCDLDHSIAWEDGGTTNAANLLPLCRRHHTLKHQGGWGLRIDPDVSACWTSPTGHVYHTPPTTHPIDHSADFDPAGLLVVKSTANNPTTNPTAPADPDEPPPF